MPDPNRQITPDNSKFAFMVPAQFAASGDGPKRKRTFSGVAYSGDVIKNHWYWGQVVFALDSMDVPDKMPALLDHSRACRVGYVTSFSKTDNEGLTVSGNLLSNDHGKAVADDSDEGFPWQMSVHIEPGSIEEIQAGTNAVVNGRTFSGPLTIFRNSRLSEVSFTATGWDSNTSAKAMAKPDTQPTPTNPTENEDMDLKEALAKIDTLTAANTTLTATVADTTAKLTEATTALANFSKDARTRDITTLFADLGRTFKADDAEVLAFAAMPQGAFDVTAKMLRDANDKAKAMPGANAGLFSHQAANTTTPPVVKPEDSNPLLADAKARAEQFARQQEAQRRH